MADAVKKKIPWSGGCPGRSKTTLTLIRVAANVLKTLVFMIINFTISLVCNWVCIVYELSLYCAARHSFLSFSMNLNFCLQLMSERAKRRVIRDFYCDVNPRAAKQTGEQRLSASHKKEKNWKKDWTCPQYCQLINLFTALFLNCYVSDLLNKVRWQKS